MASRTGAPDDETPPPPPGQTPNAPVKEPPEKPSTAPDAPVREPGPAPPKKYGGVSIHESAGNFNFQLCEADS